MYVASQDLHVRVYRDLDGTGTFFTGRYIDSTCTGTCSLPVDLNVVKRRSTGTGSYRYRYCEHRYRTCRSSLVDLKNECAKLFRIPSMISTEQFWNDWSPRRARKYM